jgi:hypothetical protein
MFTGTESDAIRFVWIVTSLLAILSLYLLFTSVIVRIASRFVERQKEKRKNLYYGFIIAYITGESEDTKKLEKKIKSEFDIDLFVDIIADMMTQLDGLEYPRLQALLVLPVVKSHFWDRLRSRVVNKQIEACLYYALILEVNDAERAYLRTYVTSSNALLAHAAASGLLSSNDPAIRYEAVLNMARKKRISRLALLEMLYKFHNTQVDQYEEEAEFLSELLADTSIPGNNIGVVIRGIADIGYSQLVMVLYDFLESGYRADEDDVVDGLIYAMGRFQFGPAGDWMMETTVSHPNARIRRATAHAFEIFNDTRFLPSLMILAQDSELTVRIRAIFAMVAMGPEGQAHLDQLSEQTSDLQSLIRSIRNEMETA